MRYIYLLLFIYISPLLAEHNRTIPSQPIVVEDTSGLSDNAIRKKAKDTEETIVTSSWQYLSPTPKKNDWIQTKSGEWFKGTIEAMYDKELEFDSSEIGHYSFNFKDISQIKSYHIISTNIENLASFSGILRFKNNTLTIIQGDHSFSFKKSQIVSFAKSGDLEKDNWSGKITFNLDIRKGNKEQLNYSSQINLKRRTSQTRLRLDYFGRISTNENKEIANDHRINEKFDIYLTRDFFWTPLFSEYYQDNFQNIASQYTAGMGIGYTVFDKSKYSWDISGGPAIINTNFDTVSVNGKTTISSASLEISTTVEYELSKKMDLTYNYSFSITEKSSGLYKHHMILKLENEILSWLDFDITSIWDYTRVSEKDEFGVSPLSSDYQLLFGLGVEF